MSVTFPRYSRRRRRGSHKPLPGRGRKEILFVVKSQRKTGDDHPAARLHGPFLQGYRFRAGEVTLEGYDVKILVFSDL